MMKKYRLLILTAGWVLVLDQLTKFAVRDRLPLFRRIPVIPGFFNLIHVHNTGGAFGIFSGQRGGLGTLFFTVVSLLAVCGILFLFAKSKEHERTLRFGLSLVLAGALGNLLDRVRLGEVVDFLEFYVSTFYWPAFNIADSAICLGIGLMALEMLRKPPSQG
jgi:signal peptidase II